MLQDTACLQFDGQRHSAYLQSMIEAHLKGLARRCGMQDTCIQRCGVCVCVCISVLQLQAGGSEDPKPPDTFRCHIIARKWPYCLLLWLETKAFQHESGKQQRKIQLKSLLFLLAPWSLSSLYTLNTWWHIVSWILNSINNVWQELRIAQRWAILGTIQTSIWLPVLCIFWASLGI